MIDLNHASGCQYGGAVAIAGHHRADRRGDRPGARCPQPSAGRRAPTSAPPGSAAPACARSSTTTSPCRRTRAATSSRGPCASSRPGIAARTSSPTGCGSPASTCRTERADGRQFGFSALDGRFKGHIDGCLVAGPVPLAYPALWENKALGAASWKDVVKRGLTLSKPVYAAQIALYQAYLELPNPALFTALNRDTMELYSELVPFDPSLAQTHERSRRRGGARERRPGAAAAGRAGADLRALPRRPHAPANGTAPAPGRTAAGARRHDRLTPRHARPRRSRAIKDWFENRTARAAGVSAVRLCRHRQDHRAAFALDELGLEPHQGERDGGCVPGVVTATFTGKAA